MRRAPTRILPLLLVLTLVLASSAARAESGPDGRVHVSYWEKWTGVELDAMRAVVSDFNASQDRIFVDLTSVSSIRSKTLIATAGGNPPDLAGLEDDYIIDLADKNALTPLEDRAKGTEITAERYIPVYWDMTQYRGHLWGVPTTPVIVGLLWNKDLFRAAGLDPERPPRTIAELDEYAKKLTRKNPATGELEVIGFMHSEPGFWPHAWGYFFGGNLWDGGEHLTVDSPENIRAYEWVQSYAKTYGVQSLQALRSSFGSFSSPQNAFISGKVAMELQGVWMGNLIATYNPKLRWGAAPFPSAEAGKEPVAFANADMLVIPVGARHPNEAFEFMKYMARQGPLEKLCLGQSKNSPLREVSAEFFKEHSNPYIRMYQDLALSPNTTHMPYIGVWRQYENEIINAFDRIWLLRATPQEALKDARERAQFAWDRDRQRQARAEEAGPGPWLRFAPLALLGCIAAVVSALATRSHRKTLAAAGGQKPARANASFIRGMLFFSPWLVGLLVFVLYPITSSIVYSFCDYSVLSEPRFVGLLNYQDLLHDQVFWIVLKNTALYAVLALPLGLLVAFSFALLLSSNVRGIGIYRTLIFMPSLTPLVASAMVWLWVFNSQHGVLNYLLSKVTFGLIHNVAWLNDVRFAMPSLVMMSLWGVGNTVVIMLAAMQEVPSSLYEAADIDGAGMFAKVRHITIPMISPVLYFNAILGIIGVTQVFTIPYIMTTGRPARSTYFYAMYLYDGAFSFLRMGYACAMAWILFLIILGLTAVAVRVGKTRVHYSG